jgi:hypothetical protein
MTTLTCYACAEIERDCCGGGTFDECFSGLLIDVSGAQNLLYAPLDVFRTSGDNGLLIMDRQGAYAAVYTSATDFADTGEMQEFVCQCSGLPIGDEYDDDMAAASGGIGLNRYYVLTTANIYGLPQGTVKKRVT